MGSERADAVEVEVEQGDLGGAPLQHLHQVPQQVVGQARVPQHQLLHLVRRVQHRHHGVKLQVERRHGRINRGPRRRVYAAAPDDGKMVPFF